MEKLGDYTNALKYYDKALEIKKVVLGLEHPDTVMTYYSLVGVYESKITNYGESNDLVQEKKLIQKVINSQPKVFLKYESIKKDINNDIESHETLKNEKTQYRSEVFVCYADPVRETDNEFFLELILSLDALCMNFKDKITYWYDAEIKRKWNKAIGDHLSVAKVAILFISEAFIASDYIRNNELPVLFQAAEDGEVEIIWILLEPCQVEDVTIKLEDGNNVKIIDYQSKYYRGKKSLKAMEEFERKEAYKFICEEIKEAYGII